MFGPRSLSVKKNSLSRKYKKRVSGGGGRNIRETGKQICNNATLGGLADRMKNAMEKTGIVHGTNLFRGLLGN